MTLLSREKKSYRQIAHHLEAVVMIGDQGITDGVRQETIRALKDHELIKVKLALTDREARNAAATTLAKDCDAEIVQSIGKVVVLYKENRKANPKLSNVKRFE